MITDAHQEQPGLLPTNGSRTFLRSLLQETKVPQQSRKCSFIPPSRLRQVGVSKKGVTRGLLVAWTASQAPESSKCAQGDTSTSTFFVLIFAFMFLNC